jgi:serine/threonine-protein kinase HipA
MRIHTEDFSQILGATDEQKYFWANQDTIVNVTKRFSADPLGDAFEAIRRLVIDIMIGNGDGHLKNWSLLLQDGRTARRTDMHTHG